MNIGVCGTGTVGSWISSIVGQRNSETLNLYACASPRGTDCTEFASRFGYDKAYDSCETLMDDLNVDLVYIAVPNIYHYDLAKRALEKGKNVFLEKPFAMNVRQTRELIELAKEKKLFLAEAVWPAFLPMGKEIDRLIAQGIIGEITGGTIVSLNNVMFLDRVKKPELGGGYMLDNGAYTLGFMTQHFGMDIAEVSSAVRTLDTGVDAEADIQVRYRSGITVTVRQQMDAETEYECAEIFGTKGTICLPGIANPEYCRIYDQNGNLIRELVREKQIVNQGMPPVAGYDYEFEAVEKAIREGKQELGEITWERTLAIAQIVETVLLNAGIDLTSN